jgi:hypothetical protein
MTPAASKARAFTPEPGSISGTGDVDAAANDATPTQTSTTVTSLLKSPPPTFTDTQIALSG